MLATWLEFSRVLFRSKQGDVLGVARVAAIQAANRTSDLIPLAHPIAITRVAVDFELQERTSSVVVSARVECRGRTGVEMEALKIGRASCREGEGSGAT